MFIWVDDIRTPPEGWDNFFWARTSQEAIDYLAYVKEYCYSDAIQVMSLDHDLGGDDTTRPIVIWMIENDYWPNVVRVHSQNPIGVTWLEGMVERYHPSNAHKYTR